MNEDELDRPKGRGLELFGVSALALTLAGLFLGQAAQQFAAQNVSPAMKTAQAPRFNAIDYAATAAVKGGAVIIGPCDTPAH